LGGRGEGEGRSALLPCFSCTKNLEGKKKGRGGVGREKRGRRGREGSDPYYSSTFRGKKGQEVRKKEIKKKRPNPPKEKVGGIQSSKISKEGEKVDGWRVDTEIYHLS